jgi:hypothetical protein
VSIPQTSSRPRRGRDGWPQSFGGAGLLAGNTGPHVLAAGTRRTDYHYTEGGGLLTMQFFAGLDQWSPIDILFGFERSHPAAQIRTPVIQQTANTWRASGGTLPPVF